MDEKMRRKNMFLTDKISLFGFRVGGLFYPIIFFPFFSSFSVPYFYAISYKFTEDIGYFLTYNLTEILNFQKEKKIKKKSIKRDG